MNLPIEKDVKVRKGDTFALGFCIKDKVFNAEQVRDLSGYTAAGMVRSSPEVTSSIVATMTFSSSGADLDNGIIRLKIPWATTATIPVGQYYYDVYVTNTSAEKQTYFTGKFIVVDRLTS